MKIKTGIPIKGQFSAFIVEGDDKKKIYEQPNQIQYEGANDIALALTDKAEVFPKLNGIITSVPLIYDPGTAKGKDKRISDIFELTTIISGTSFLATPSSSGQQQVIVCQAMFMDYLLTEDDEEGKYYEFELTLDTGHALAYEYIPGGISWGAGQSLQVVWTLYLGTT